MLPLVVLLVHPRCFLFTPSIMLVRVLRTMPNQLRVEGLVSSMALLTSTGRLLHQTASLAYIVVSFPRLLASLCTVVSTSASMTPSVRVVCYCTLIPVLTSG